MKTVITALFISLSVITFAQDEDYENEERNVEQREKRERKEVKKRNPNEVKTLTSNGHHGGFIGFTFKSTQFNNSPAVTLGARTGWILGRAVGIGFEAHGIIPSVKLDNIIPNEKAILLGGYGGMFLEPIILSNQVIHLTFPIAGGTGWMGYHEDWEYTYEYTGMVDEDVYWYVEPGVAVELNVTRNFRIAGGVTQRFTQDLELTNTSANAFDNRNYFITLKLGRF